MNLAAEFIAAGIGMKVIQSLGLIVALIALRTLLARAIVHNVSRPDLRNRWVVSVRNAALLVLLIGLVAIWAEALRTFAVSLVAIAVAFVLTTKEILQSVLASVVKPVTNPFTVGDRIEIGSHRGDVIDQNLFTTTILEVGPGRSFHMRTGRKITFPNVKLLDSFVVNESFTKRYVIHVFSVPMKTDQDWKRAEEVLLEAAKTECEPFLDEARATMRETEEQYGLVGLPTQPRVSIQITEAGKLTLLVRVPVPVGRQGRIEQAIIRRFLEEIPQKLEEPESAKE